MRARRWFTTMAVAIVCAAVGASCGSKDATTQPRSASNQARPTTGTTGSAAGDTANAATQPPTASNQARPTTGTTASAAGDTADAAVRASLGGLWMQAAENVDDATALPGPDWFGVSFVTGAGAPLIVVTPCETVVSHGYQIVDGRLVLTEPLTRPTTQCPSAKLDRRTNQLYTQLAGRPTLTVTGDQLSIDGDFVFTRNDEIPLERAEHTPTLDELRGRTFSGLAVNPNETEPATLTFGPYLVVRTPCSVIEADAAITDGRLRATVTKRTLVDRASCDDSNALAIITSWPRVSLNDTLLLLATAGMSSGLAERPTPSVAPTTTALSAP